MIKKKVYCSKCKLLRHIVTDYRDRDEFLCKSKARIQSNSWFEVEYNDEEDDPEIINSDNDCKYYEPLVGKVWLHSGKKVSTKKRK